MTRPPPESLSSLTSGSGGRFEPGKSVVMPAIYANAAVYEDEEDDVILDDLKNSWQSVSFMDCWTRVSSLAN